MPRKIYPRGKHFGSVEIAHDEAVRILSEVPGHGRHIVYGLKCDNSREVSAFKHDAAIVFGSEAKIASWAWAAHNATNCYYVGSTTNFVNRFIEHCTNAGSRGAWFTGLFPPMEIVRMSRFSRPADAMNAEAVLANTLRDELDEEDIDGFVYQR